MNNETSLTKIYKDILRKYDKRQFYDNKDMSKRERNLTTEIDFQSHHDKLIGFIKNEVFNSLIQENLCKETHLKNVDNVLQLDISNINCYNYDIVSNNVDYNKNDCNNNFVYFSKFKNEYNLETNNVNNFQNFKTNQIKIFHPNYNVTSIKKKYYNRMRIASSITGKLNMNRAQNTDFTLSNEIAFYDKSLLENNSEIKLKSQNVLDSFLQKYSEENITKGFHKRLKDVNLTSKFQSSHFEEKNPITLLKDNAISFNYSLNSHQVNKKYNNSSNIQYNISNPNKKFNEKIMTFLDEKQKQQLKIEKINIGFTIDKSQQFSILNKKGTNYQIESVYDKIDCSIISNEKVNKNQVYLNSDDNSHKNVINKNKVIKMKDEIQIITKEEYINPFNKLENLKRLKKVLDEDLKKNFIEYKIDNYYDQIREFTNDIYEIKSNHLSK